MSNLFKNLEFLYFLVINWLTNMKIISKFDRNKILVNDLINYILDCKKNKIKKLLNERKLSELFNIKRSEIRDALLILENKEIILRKPGSGTFINYNFDETAISILASLFLNILNSFRFSFIISIFIPFHPLW